MSADGHAERLARALGSLQYVEPISWEGTEFGTIKVLCRVQTSCLGRWAKIVEEILKRAESLEGEPEQWDSHICRLYMLKDGNLVYGWLVAITSPYMEDSLGALIPLLKARAPAAKPNATPHTPHPSVTSQQTAPNPHQGKRVVLAVPESDRRGNPIVPDSHKVTMVPMAGLNPNLDRNAPSDNTEGKGAHGMFKSKWGEPFKPGK